MTPLLLAASAVLLSAATVERREVTLGDLVRTMDGRHLAGADASPVVLRLAAGRSVTVLDAGQVRALVRRWRPLLRVRGTGRVTITQRMPVVGATGCWASVRALAMGEVVGEDDVVPAPCHGAAAGPITHGGRDHVPTMRVARPTGAMLGRFVPADRDRVDAGTALLLRVALGPVAIERTVTTLQPARAGRRVFVRDGDGQVFAAPLAEERR